MWTARLAILTLGGAMAIAPMSGCEDLPGGPETQGAVIGGVAGAAGGALIGGEENRLLGALIGGAAGAGGGYLIGAQMDDPDVDEDDREAAQAAVREAETDPATVEDVRESTTADLNNDGFVTMDEVIAMERAGLGDQEILRRLDATNQIFELTNVQEDYLRDQGLSPFVVSEMQKINYSERQRLLQQRQNIGSEY